MRFKFEDEQYQQIIDDLLNNLNLSCNIVQNGDTLTLDISLNIYNSVYGGNRNLCCCSETIGLNWANCTKCGNVFEREVYCCEKCKKAHEIEKTMNNLG